MTVGVDADLRIREYPGDDSATARPVPFYFLDAGDLKVTRVNVDGSETVLVRGTDYSVAGAGNPAGGSVTPLAPIATGTIWRIEGDMTLAQPTDYTAGDDFPSESHERALDRAMIAHQEARRDINDAVARALTVPRGEAGGQLPAALQRAGRFLAWDADGQPVMASGIGADAALRADLAEPTGASLSKTSRGNSVERELTWARAATPASINEFYDAVNGDAAERMALEAAAATGRAVAWRGTLTMDQQPNLPARTSLIGEGSTSDNGTRGNTCIVRGFAGTGPLLLLLGDATLRNIDVDGDGQGTGDNIQIIGERVTLDNVSTRKSGGRGVWIGDLDNDTLNANCWSIYALKSIYNAGAGLYIHHTNSDTGVTWPIGAANVNAGSLFGADIRSNGGHGLHIGNAVDNKFYGLVVQNNVGSNIYLDDYARGNSFFSPYSELGGAADTFTALSSGNLILGTSSVVPSNIVDNGDGNVVMQHVAALKEQVFSGRVGIAPVYQSGEGARLDLYNDELDLAAQVFGEKTGIGSQGKGVATAKRNGNTPIEVFEWAPDGKGLNILNGVLRVAGTQVIGAQGAAVADATDATSTTTQLNELLARCRAHGIIAS